MKAIILAGGKGTRLQPYTTVIPKPLMPVGNYPILEILLRQLKHFGIDDIVLAVGYMAQLFQAFFQAGERYGLKIRYSMEDEPMGTAGPLSLLIDELDDDFLVMNGDLLTTLDYRHLYEFHKRKKAAATLSMYQRDIKIDFGVVEPDADNKLVNYIEKPNYHFKVSMGVNVLNPTAIRPYLAPGKYLDLPDLLMLLHKDGQPVYCFSEDCFWLDIGRVDDYQIANEVFESRKNEFLRGERLP